MAIDCLVLGAGQEVRKSCVVVTIGEKRIMFDCGMHMGYQDHRRYPDFSLISDSGDFNASLTCVIITHFHLDHVGALAYFTEVCGYNGPIYMTYPTRALSPLMLEDYRKVMADRRGEEEQFTSDHIMDCMKKVTTVDLKQTIQVDKDLQIRAYYAGHVLGAAMFYAKVGDSAFVYTGDYNMTPDRHLGAAQIDRLQLDLELCMLLDDYWERLNLKIPIYFSAGLTIQANMYYKMLIGWTSQSVKDSYATKNAFDFKHVCSFERSLINAPGPCVLFATPGVLSGGFSLEVFKLWAPSEKNLITLPGYCVAGTVGHKLMSGKPGKIFVDKETQIDVKCQIHQLSFSPHTDAKGIMDLVKFLSPKHVILVHGEKPKMATLKGRIESELQIPCYYPANNESVHIASTQYVKMDASESFIQNCLKPTHKCLKSFSDSNTNYTTTVSSPITEMNKESVAEGFLIMEKTKRAKAVHKGELMPTLALEEHKIQFAHCCSVNAGTLLLQEQDQHNDELSESLSTGSTISEMGNSSNALAQITGCFSATKELPLSDQLSQLHLLFLKLSKELAEEKIQEFRDHLQVESFHVSICQKNNNCPCKIKDFSDVGSVVSFCCKWSLVDQNLAWRVISVIKGLDATTV
ncbi:hypothetical protein C5167_005283 [Papaver somniferum]|uniref:Metallo-beta-lactamase domain-containing protein n=1 Tax=Papaver somniferum TaxID=3469 RepID=A0A4Y7JAY8_PAPSO|nr:hypothetical protein C5167_005283 [Papaver somniferum]